MMQKHTILVVDDEETDRSSMLDALSRKGYDVVSAETYEEAGAAAHATAPDAAKAHDHASHDHGWSPSPGLPRFFFTAITTIATAIGMSLLLMAGMIFADNPTPDSALNPTDQAVLEKNQMLGVALAESGVNKLIDQKVAHATHSSFISNAYADKAEADIKAKKPRKFYYRLPALGTLDELISKFMGLGFVLFTLGVIAVRQGDLLSHYVLER